MDVLRGVSESIRIIHDDNIAPSVIAQARDALEQAKTICFLGFGYHPMNLERLDVKKLEGPRYRLFGTGYGLSEGERGAVLRRFHGSFRLDPETMKVHDFLKESDVIHG